ncbi:hypothetical protein ACOTHJ_14785 [Achromobacter xylosoxidans]
MNLSNNFARALRIQNLTFSGTFTDGRDWNLNLGRNSISASISLGLKKSWEHQTFSTAGMCDAEILRTMAAALPAHELMTYFTRHAGASTAFSMGLADRLRRAYEEPDVPNKKYEKPLMDAAKIFFAAVMEAFDMPISSDRLVDSRANLIVRRGATASAYSPVVAGVVIKLPFGSNRTRDIQLVADPSPFSDNGWCLRINPIAFSPEETGELHKRYSIAMKRLEDNGYELSPIPWVGQLF